MLKIINNLKPFFEDCYRRISVREYAKLIKISPPTASKILEEYKKNNFLIKEKDNQYNYYYINKDNKTLKDISKIYWRNELKNTINQIKEEFISPTIILFGSLSKLETKKDSDIDLAVFSISKKKINIKSKRNIQIFKFKNRKDVKNINLLNNILNGYILEGKWTGLNA
jgi:DNA-binding transcriptional regulator YhcF (GntR family)|tara:strand:+ start:83 stop:589 length:507 start_codon:yes stop_codon:yes gene_type:complete